MGTNQIDVDRLEKLLLKAKPAVNQNLTSEQNNATLDYALAMVDADELEGFIAIAVSIASYLAGYHLTEVIAALCVYQRGQTDDIPF